VNEGECEHDHDQCVINIFDVVNIGERRNIFRNFHCKLTLRDVYSCSMVDERITFWVLFFFQWKETV
jgi:hypothetical protein